MADVQAKILAHFGKPRFRDPQHGVCQAGRPARSGGGLPPPTVLPWAMDVSTHSFVRMAEMVEPLMEKTGGGSLITTTYLDSGKGGIANYGVMGLCKAALGKRPPAIRPANWVEKYPRECRFAGPLMTAPPRALPALTT